MVANYDGRVIEGADYRAGCVPKYTRGNKIVSDSHESDVNSVDDAEKSFRRPAVPQESGQESQVLITATQAVKKAQNQRKKISSLATKTVYYSSCVSIINFFFINKRPKTSRYSCPFRNKFRMEPE